MSHTRCAAGQGRAGQGVKWSGTTTTSTASTATRTTAVAVASPRTGSIRAPSWQKLQLLRVECAAWQRGRSFHNCFLLLMWQAERAREKEGARERERCGCVLVSCLRVQQYIEGSAPFADDDEHVHRENKSSKIEISGLNFILAVILFTPQPNCSKKILRQYLYPKLVALARVGFIRTRLNCCLNIQIQIQNSSYSTLRSLSNTPQGLWTGLLVFCKLL